MPRLRIVVGVFLAVGLFVGLALYGARLRDLDDEARAVRLLRWHGSLCTPKIVERVDAVTLRIVCADGKHVFRVKPSDDEGLVCRLGFDVACWDQSTG